MYVQKPHYEIMPDVLERLTTARSDRYQIERELGRGIEPRPLPGIGNVLVRDSDDVVGRWMLSTLGSQPMLDQATPYVGHLQRESCVTRAACPRRNSPDEWYCE